MELEPAAPRVDQQAGGLVRFQAQAVLRRTTPSDPLLLVGVTLDGTFFPRALRDASTLFVLTKGLVALAPLTAVDAAGPAEAAAIAMADARETWNGPNSPALARRSRNS
jgi:hypothetical protein